MSMGLAEDHVRKASAMKCQVCKKSSKRSSTSTGEPMPCVCGVLMIPNSSRCVEARLRMDEEQLNEPKQGSVFVEFDDMSAVEKFLNADPKPTWEGKELLIMSKCVRIISFSLRPLSEGSGLN